jgi:non-homologous end joining protein Ku
MSQSTPNAPAATPAADPVAPLVQQLVDAQTTRLQKKADADQADGTVVQLQQALATAQATATTAHQAEDAADAAEKDIVSQLAQAYGLVPPPAAPAAS